MSILLTEPGTYLGQTVSVALARTKKSYPQAIITFKVDQKVVSTPTEIAARGMDGPGNITIPDQEITGFFVLFKDSENFDPDQFSLPSLDFVKSAFGWTPGDSFVKLADDSYVGKPVKITAAMEEYQGKTNLRVKNFCAPEDSLGISGMSADEAKKMDRGFKKRNRTSAVAVPYVADGSKPTSDEELDANTKELAL